MNNLEFLSFTTTPEEKHLGIAAIRVEKKYIFRFKIQQNPKGDGYFANAPSIKIDDNYYPSFQFDSSYEAEEAKKFVLSHVKRALQSQQNFTPTPIAFNAVTPPPQVEFDFNTPTPF